MNTAPALPRPAGADAAAAPGAVAPDTAAPASVAAAAAAPASATLAPIDRAVLALGTALVSWSRRAERRGAAHPEPALAPDATTVPAAASAGPSPTALARHAAAIDASAVGIAAASLDDAIRERHQLRRAAAASRAQILAERDLGINRLLR